MMTWPDVPWQGSAYARNTGHHRAYDDALLAGVQVPRDGTIVDVGCGVGDLTMRLRRFVPLGHVLGVDSATSMVDEARRTAGHTPGIRFVVGDVRRLDRVVARESADLVLSAAMLHWVPRTDHPLALRQVLHSLRPGGLFRADFGGAGQIAVARELLDEESSRLGGPTSPWFFPTAAEYRRLLGDAGFRIPDDGVVLVRQRRSFRTADELLGWLQSQVLVAYEARLPAHERVVFRRRCCQRALGVLRRSDGTFDQDYIRLQLLARRPEA